MSRTLLTFAKDSAVNVQAEGVRDENKALLSAATAKITLYDPAGEAVVGATDETATAVAGKPGTYRWIAPKVLNLSGSYSWKLVVTYGDGETTVWGDLVVEEYHGELESPYR